MGRDERTLRLRLRLSARAGGPFQQTRPQNRKRPSPPLTPLPPRPITPEVGLQVRPRDVNSYSQETQGITRALRRAARRALELGLKTGTPVYVVEDGKIVDLTKRKRPRTKAKTTKTRPSRSSR